MIFNLFKESLVFSIGAKYKPRVKKILIGNIRAKSTIIYECLMKHSLIGQTPLETGTCILYISPDTFSWTSVYIPK